MSKFGVGVGEDFPVDENNKPEAVGCRQRHGGRKEAWRRFRHQMHQEWLARRVACRDGLNDRDGVGPVHEFRQRHLHHLIVGGLAVLGLAALIAGLSRRD